MNNFERTLLGILVFAIAWDINTIGKLSNDLIEKIKTWDINENA